MRLLHLQLSALNSGEEADKLRHKDNIIPLLTFAKSDYLGSMKRLTPLFLFSFLHSVFNGLSAQSGGMHTFEFLNLANPARTAALGGTLISATDNDLNLSFQNPSVLDSTMHNRLSFSYVDYFSDVKYGYTAYSRTYKKLGSFSAGMQYVDYGNFIATDVTGQVTGHFTAAEYALNLSYARPIDSVFSIGATVKTIYSKLGEYTSVGNALDLGGLYHSRKRALGIALVIKNIGYQWKTYYDVHEPFPFEVQLGLSKKIKHAPFRVNFTITHLEKWDLTYVDPSIPTTDPITGAPIEKNEIADFADKLVRHVVLGTEVLISKNFYLAIGYNYLRRQELMLEASPGMGGFSFGFGLRIYKFHVSYGYAQYHAAGGPNHFTISTNFSDFYTKKK